MKRILGFLAGGLAVLAGLGACAALGLVLLFLPPAPAKPEAATAFRIQGVTLIEPGLGRREGAVLPVRDGRVSDAGAASNAGSTTFDEFAGHFVLPGLVDMHAHLPPANLLNTTGQYGALFLAHGVTSIRDAGDVDGTAIGAAREAIAAGVPMPRVFSAGPFVTAGEARWPNSIVLERPEDAAAAVRRIKAEGHTWVKSYDGLSVEMIRAVEAAADAEGLGVLGHIPHELAYEDALIRDVQHFLGVPRPEDLLGDSIPNRIADWDGVDAARMDEIVRVTLEHSIANTPTLALSRGLQRYRDYPAALNDPAIGLLPPFYAEIVWSPEIGIPVYRTINAAYLDRLDRAFTKKKELLKRLYDAGATLRLGTDQQQPFTVPGWSLQEEMRIFADAGIPLEAVWVMATRKAGAAFGVEGLGTLGEGAPADFLIFREDPTRDPAALATLEAVVAGGRLYRKAELDAAVDRWVRHWRRPLRYQISNAVVRRAVDRIAADFDH